MENKSSNQSFIEIVLRKAFWYWNKTLLYQLIYSLLYFSLFFIGYVYLFKYFGLWDDLSQASNLVRSDLPTFNKKMEEIAALPQARNFSLAVFFLLAFINPLNVGLFKIFRKTSLNEPVSVNDLFAGYLGIDFFRFFGFYLFWIIIFTYANALFLLGFVWIFVTLFSVPLMFFMEVKTFESIRLTVKSLRNNFGMIAVGCIVAMIFSVCGLLLFGVGFLLTFPFWHAMIYALYEKIYHEVN